MEQEGLQVTAHSDSAEAPVLLWHAATAPEGRRATHQPPDRDAVGCRKPVGSAVAEPRPSLVRVLASFELSDSSNSLTLL